MRCTWSQPPPAVSMLTRSRDTGRTRLEHNLRDDERGGRPYPGRVRSPSERTAEAGAKARSKFRAKTVEIVLVPELESGSVDRNVRPQEPTEVERPLAEQPALLRWEHRDVDVREVAREDPWSGTVERRSTKQSRGRVEGRRDEGGVGWNDDPLSENVERGLRAVSTFDRLDKRRRRLSEQGVGVVPRSHASHLPETHTLRSPFDLRPVQSAGSRAPHA
jgi:hypothetical protein